MLDLAINRPEITYIFFPFELLFIVYTVHYATHGKHIVRKMLPSHNIHFFLRYSYCEQLGQEGENEH